MPSLNSSTVARAESLIRAGKIHHGSWSAPVGSERSKEDCLGFDKNAAPAAKCSYPVIVNGMVSSHAIQAAGHYSDAAGHSNIHAAVAKLSALMKEHEDKAPKEGIAAANTGPEDDDDIIEDEPVLDKPMSFVVSTQCDFGYEASAPGVAMASTSYPPTRNGQPCTYYEKELMPVGEWMDAKGKKFTVTPERLDRLAANFHKLKAKGFEPFLPLDKAHPETVEEKAKSLSVGFLTDVYRKGNSLYGVHQFVGDPKEAALLAATQKSSIRTYGDVTTVDGEHYDEVIDHNLICPNPRWDSLESFKPLDTTTFKPALAASRGHAIEAVSLSMATAYPTGANMAMVDCTDSHMERAKKALPHMADSMDHGNIMDRLVTHAETHPMEKGVKMSRDLETAASKLSTAEADVARLTAELAAANQRATEAEAAKGIAMSRAIPSADPSDIEVAGQNAEEKKNHMIANGWSPDGLKRVIDVLCQDGKLSGLAMSRAPGEPTKRVIYAVLDAINTMSPPSGIAMGRQSGVQKIPAPGAAAGKMTIKEYIDLSKQSGYTVSEADAKSALESRGILAATA